MQPLSYTNHAANTIEKNCLKKISKEYLFKERTNCTMGSGPNGAILFMNPIHSTILMTEMKIIFFQGSSK